MKSDISFSSHLLQPDFLIRAYPCPVNMAERDVGAEGADHQNQRQEPVNLQDQQSKEEDGRGSGNGVLNDQDAKAPEVHSPAGWKAGKVLTADKVEEKEKPSKVKELRGKLGLDMGTVMMMFKWVLRTEM